MDIGKIKNEIRQAIDSGNLEGAINLISSNEQYLIGDPDFNEIMAILHIYAGNYNEAEKLLESLLEKSPNADLYYNMAYVKKMTGRLSDSVVYHALSARLSDNDQQVDELLHLYDGSPVEKRMFDIVRDSPKRTYIILSSNTFSNIYQRTHHIAFSLKKMGQEVYYINPPKKLEVNTAVNLQTVNQDIASKKYYVENIEVYQPLLYSLNNRFVYNSTAEILNQLMNASSFDVVIIAYLPEYIHILKQLNHKYFLIYDCVDDHSSAEVFWGSAGASYDEQEMMDRADTITATATALYLQRAVIEKRKNVFLSRNAVDESDFILNDDACPNDLINIPSPRVCYIGALYQWFDENLFLETVKNNPDISFVIIGFGDLLFREIPPNLYSLGRKEFRKIKQYLKYIDIGIIPFRAETDVIVCCDAIKTYEYLMSYKPVITTMMPENSIQKPYTMLVDTAEEFTAAIKTQLNQEVDKTVIDDFIRENNWNQRASLFIQIANKDTGGMDTGIVLDQLRQEFQLPYEKYNHPVINTIYAMTLYAGNNANANAILEAAYHSMPESRFVARQYFCLLLANNEMEKLLGLLLSADYLRVEQKCEIIYRKSRGDDNVLRYIAARFLNIENAYTVNIDSKEVVSLMSVYVFYLRNNIAEAYKGIESHLINRGKDKAVFEKNRRIIMQSPLFLFLCEKISSSLGKERDAELFRDEYTRIKDSYMSGDIHQKKEYEKKPMESAAKRNSTIETWDAVAKNYHSAISATETAYAHELYEIFRLAGIIPGSKIMELGSGSGHLSAIFAKLGYKVSLLDFSPVAIQKSKELFQLEKLDGAFIEGDLFDLKITSLDQYDLIWNSGVMEHFDDHELAEVMNNIRSVSSNVFILTVPNLNSIPYLMFRYFLMATGRWTYGKEFLRDDYESVLRNAGFKYIEKTYVGGGFMPSMMSSFPSNNLLPATLEDMLKNKVIPISQYYLTAYVAGKGPIPNLKFLDTRVGAGKQTDSFDYAAKEFGKRLK